VYNTHRCVTRIGMEEMGAEDLALSFGDKMLGHQLAPLTVVGPKVERYPAKIKCSDHPLAPPL